MSAGIYPLDDQTRISMRSKTRQRILLADFNSNGTTGFNETNFIPYNQTGSYNTTISNPTNPNWDVFSGDFWNTNGWHPLKWGIVIGSPVLFILIICVFICFCCWCCKQSKDKRKGHVVPTKDPDETEENQEINGFDAKPAPHNAQFSRLATNETEEELAEIQDVVIERKPLIEEEVNIKVSPINDAKAKFLDHEQIAIEMVDHSREFSKKSTTKSTLSPEILDNISEQKDFEVQTVNNDQDDSMEDMYNEVEQSQQTAHHHHQITMNGIPANRYHHQYPYNNHLQRPTSPISNYSNNQLVQPQVSYPYHHQNTPSLPGECGLNTFIAKSQWSTEQVAEWVGGLGKIFKKYVQNFRDHGINGLSLCQYGNNPDKLKTVFGKVVSDEVHRDNIVVRWIHLPCNCKWCSDSLSK